eukprot:365530-Chlamydomonas_euryale.AAC.22
MDASMHAARIAPTCVSSNSSRRVVSVRSPSMASSSDRTSPTSVEVAGSSGSITALKVWPGPRNVTHGAAEQSPAEPTSACGRVAMRSREKVAALAGAASPAVGWRLRRRPAVRFNGVAASRRTASTDYRM